MHHFVSICITAWAITFTEHDTILEAVNSTAGISTEARLGVGIEPSL